MSMSYAEMREITSLGLHNDTYWEKQQYREDRKHGWKIMGINRETYQPYVLERGFQTREAAVACIQEMGWEDVFVKEADPSDDDYYTSGEKGYWASMSDEEYEYYSERLEEGMLFD